MARAGHALLALMICCGAAAPLTAGDESRMYDPRFREGAPSDPLVVGPPRLSRGHLNAFVDLFESSFDLALPAGVEQDLRDALESRFERAGDEWRDALLDLTDTIVRLRCCGRCGNRAGVRTCLRRFRASIDSRVRKAPDEPAHRILLRVLERRHDVVWLGDPEVKDLSATAYLEMTQFVASLGRNERVRLSPGQLSALRDHLDRGLRRLDKACRVRLAAAHRTWLLAKARWDRGRDSRRFSMRCEAVRLAARLVPREGGIQVELRNDLASYARAASKVREADTAFDAATALARNPEALLQALSRGLALRRNVPAFTFLYR